MLARSQNEELADGKTHQAASVNIANAALETWIVVATLKRLVAKYQIPAKAAVAQPAIT